MYYCLAQNFFTADAAAAVVWCQKVLLSNLTYFRLRRELHEEFSRIVNPQHGVPFVSISQESFIVIRYFLTARNDVLDDNKRLSFDKAILALLNDAQRAIPPPPPRGILAAVGLGP